MCAAPPTPMPDRARVMLVDDEEAILHMMKQVLLREGYDVQVATCLEDAATLFDLQPTDVLVVDKNLPGATGFEVIVKLRERYPELPAILITAYPEPVLPRTVKIQGYLAKPFSRLAELTDSVRSVLRIQAGLVDVGLARPRPPPLSELRKAAG